jgi:two-component system OmpR family response regulator
VLDIKMPRLDGMELLTRLRREHDLPVIFLTSLTDETDEALGLRMGADDYITKPFSLAEVVMRVRAVLRRTTAPAGPGSELRFADLLMDVEAHQVWRGGTPIQLTATEFRLLHLFLLNPGRVLSKGQILDHVWQYDFDGESNILETYVSYLRRKLNEHGPPLIHTVRLVGYVLREPTAS